VPDDVLTVRDTLHKSAWRQWSCVDGDRALKLIPDINGHHKQILSENNGCILIVTLYDCAVINGSFEKEPWLSYVLVKPIAKIDNSFAFARNERVLHFNLVVNGDELPFEVTAASFGLCHRQALLDISSIDSVCLSDGSKRVLLKWIQRRTAKPTFPDEFNSRVSTKSRQLAKLFQRYDKENITGFYIRLSPRTDELNNMHAYEVTVLVSVEDSHARQFIREKEQELLMKLSSFFESIQLVNLVGAAVMSEGQITLSMLREYDLWSPEYHSFKAQPEGLPPVDIVK